MKKNKWLGTLIGCSTLMAALFHIGNSTLIEAAQGPAAPYTDMVLAPGVNVVNPGGSNTEIPGDYGSMFKITQNISYVPRGVSSTLNLATSTKVYRFNPATVASEKSVYINNAGLYNGKSIDMKLVIDELNFAETSKGSGVYPNLNFIAVSYQDRGKTNNLPIGSITEYSEMFLFMGSASSTVDGFGDKYNVGDKAAYHYEFYDNATKASVNFKGTWNFNNINSLKAVTTDFDGNFDNMYVLSNSFIGYHEAKPGTIELYGTGFTINDERSVLTDLFTGTSYKTSIERRTVSPVPSPSAMGIMYKSMSLARIAPATPIVYGEKNSAVHTDNNYLTLNYSILQSIADNKLENRNTTFVLKTEVPSYYTIDKSKIKVYEYGTDTDLTSLFTIALDPTNGSIATLTAKDSTSEAFNGKVYDIKVSAKPNATFSFDKVAYGYQVGGPDDQHMTFELGGPTTSVHYTYKTLFDKTLPSEVVANQSKGKVLYEGVPNADVKTGITFAKGTDLSSIDKEKTAYLDNIRVDTGNPSDEPVTVSYKNGVGPDSSVTGTQKITLVLTSAKGVTTEKEVEITITEVSATLKVEFVNEAGVALNPPIIKTKNIGEHLNLTTDADVIAVVNRLTADNRDVTRPTNETDFVIADGENIAKYQFTGKLTLISAPSLMDFGVEEATNYADTRVEDVTIDQPLVVSDTRAVLESWTLTAKLVKPLSSVADQSIVLPDAIIYNDGKKDITIQAISTDIVTKKLDAPGSHNISDGWAKNGAGFKVNVPAGAVSKLGKYQATLEFTLADTK